LFFIQTFFIYIITFQQKIALMNIIDKWNEKYQQLISMDDDERENTFLQKSK